MPVLGRGGDLRERGTEFRMDADSLWDRRQRPRRTGARFGLPPLKSVTTAPIALVLMAIPASQKLKGPPSALAPSEFLKELSAELASGDIRLPSFPDVAQRVQRALEDPATR
jgi:hypothetical protein